MKATYYGHGCFGLEIGGKHLLFDPFISPNELAKGVDIEAIKADYILLTHGHQDHVVDAERIGRKNDSTIVAAYELASYYGAKNMKYHPMNIGGRWDFGSFWVKCVNAVHSSVLPDGTYAGNPMGFLIGDGSKTYYFSGDTALTLDMQLIAMTNSIEAAFLCMGDNFTMGVDDSIMSAQFVKTKKVVGMHYDTFPYIKIDHAKAQAKYAEAGIALTLPEIGKPFEL